jgi:cell division protein FtsL
VENAYLVRERDRKLVRELARVSFAVALLGLGLLTYTWIHIEITAVGYRIEALDRQLHQLQQEERRLLLERTYLSRPERVEMRAREELSMGPPTLDQTLFFEELVP